MSRSQRLAAARERLRRADALYRAHDGVNQALADQWFEVWVLRVREVLELAVDVREMRRIGASIALEKFSS